MSNKFSRAVEKESDEYLTLSKHAVYIKQFGFYYHCMFKSKQINMRILIAVFLGCLFIPAYSLAQSDTISCAYDIDRSLGRVYTQVDQPATPVKGDQFLLNTIGKELRVSAESMSNQDQKNHLIVMETIIDKNGQAIACKSLQNPSADSSIHTRFLSILQEVEWVPAECENQSVPFKLIFPISINLE